MCLGVQLGDILKLLHKNHTRNYKNYDQVDSNVFKSQSYFITHFLFVMSGWGLVHLERKLFEKEYIFLTDNLEAVMKNCGVELTGEFLFCLYLFGKEIIEDEKEQVHEGQKFLLDVEEKLGKRGCWISMDVNKSFYTQYHAACCAIMGLLDLLTDVVQDDVTESIIKEAAKALT